ncbi:MAG: hypothetical protein NT169_18190 [Chloroflexi bacterium]|nr:hypothetical protein [Chloroflexota bacterium]
MSKPPVNRGEVYLVKENAIQFPAVPGFWLRVEWLWQPPHVLQALRELQVV